jgi:hypothetical protein
MSSRRRNQKRGRSSSSSWSSFDGFRGQIKNRKNSRTKTWSPFSLAARQGPCTSVGRLRLWRGRPRALSKGTFLSFLPSPPPSGNRLSGSGGPYGLRDLCELRTLAAVMSLITAGKNLETLYVLAQRQECGVGQVCGLGGQLSRLTPSPSPTPRHSQRQRWRRRPRGRQPQEEQADIRRVQVSEPLESQVDQQRRQNSLSPSRDNQTVTVPDCLPCERLQ